MERGILVPRGVETEQEWMDAFLRMARAGVDDELGPGSNPGTLDELKIESAGGDLWVRAAFVMDGHPDVTFSWGEPVIPELSEDWDPEFAATLFKVHLIEWFHTVAKRQKPDQQGVVRG